MFLASEVLLTWMTCDTKQVDLSRWRIILVQIINKNDWQNFIENTHTHTHTLIYIYTGWNDKIVALEKTTWFHFHLKKTGFLLVADHLLIGQLCTNPKSDRSLLSCLKVTPCSTSEIGDAPLYNSCPLPIQVMTTGPLLTPSKCKSGRFNT